jgi:AraC-like DNA-binding protein
MPGVSFRAIRCGRLVRVGARQRDGALDDETLATPALVRRDRILGTMQVPHRHPTVEFNLVLAGQATYLLAGRRYDLGPRSLVWLFPGQTHLMVGRSPDYRDWLCLATQSELARWCTTDHTRELLDHDPPGVFVRRLPASAANALDALLSRIVAGSDEAVATGRLYAVLAAWDAWRTAEPARDRARLHPAVRASVQTLSGADPPPDLVGLARAVGLSPQHLSRLFLRETGVSVSRFRNEQRFRRFLDLCELQPQRSMLDRAIAAGFGSGAQFHRVFRELTGTTPAAYLDRRGTTSWQRSESVPVGGR